MRLPRGAALLCAGLLCAGCVSQYKVVVDFSPALQSHFSTYPTIEVDVAAVSDGEANEVKQAGVETYFAPDSGLRERLRSQTCFFSREGVARYVLPSRAPVWQEWKLKDPANILVVASLPPDPSMSPDADPRQLLVAIKKSVVLARTLYVLVEPQKVVQVSRSRAKAQAQENPRVEDTLAYEQWVESR
jgi:hypothetical protein